MSCVLALHRGRRNAILDDLGSVLNERRGDARVRLTMSRGRGCTKSRSSVTWTRQRSTATGTATSTIKHAVRRWCNGIMQDSHSCDPCSIPERRKLLVAR